MFKLPNIETGTLELESADMDLRDVLESVGRELASQAHAKGIELTLDIDARVPELVRGDADRVREVLMNLGRNAVEFTATGEVALELRVHESGAEGTRVYCEVRDTGPGIPAQRLATLFQPVAQLDASTRGPFGGTGRGLAIARRLIDMMQGESGIESQEGIGSRFWFAVRFGRSANAPANILQRLPPAALVGRRALTVDDDATCRRVLTNQLRRCQMDVALATSATEALRMMSKACTASRPYDVALLDNEMPDCNGEELARRINDSMPLNATRLVLLKSSGMCSDGACLAQPGFAGYLVKPVSQRELIDCLLIVLRANGHTPHSQAQSSRA